MKLYELERGDRFVLEEETIAPPDIGTYPANTWLRLGNIDGMYSYCTDAQGKVHHPVAWANVKKVGFTLIELMIVLAILGIVLAIAIPQYAAWRKGNVIASEQAKTQRPAVHEDVRKMQ